MVVKEGLLYSFCCILCKEIQHEKQQFVEKSCGVFMFTYVALTFNKREYCQGINYLYDHLVELLHKNTTMVVKHRKHKSTFLMP